EIFNGLSLAELAVLDLAAAEVEGVSGATMTSLAVAEGAVAAAAAAVDVAKPSNADREEWLVSPHDFGTALVIAAGVAIGTTTWRASKSVRIMFQLVLIGYLGLTAGNLMSQAMLVGWAKHGVPWRSALGLVMLSAAALALPISTRRNLYCTHLCPHGAAQQLLRNRLGRKVRLGRSLRTVLALIPALLLAWCLIVGMTSLGFSLVDIEPFDAYLFRIAGGATIAIAVVGLVASLLVPMAYCRYGCPTGAVLEFLRLNARSDRWTLRDTVAVGYLLLALGLAIR
ncbi:MAG: 4Fe-4S binding protein, partial [Planctomycetota bacterium]